MINKPNLFIIGVAKAGTTSLAAYLAQHPEVYMSNVKEPNFFSNEFLKEIKLYYGNTFIESEREYLKLFQKATKEKVVGEASVSYFQFPKTAKKIFNHNPNSKIVILLRDPIKRAISHYLMDKRLGFVNESLDDIVLNRKKYNLYFQQYIEQGLYHYRIEEYQKYFSSDQIFILKESETLKDRFNDLLTFLELSQYIPAELNHNQAFAPKYKFLTQLYKNQAIRGSFNVIASDTLKEKIKSALFTKQSYILNKESYEYLIDYYDYRKDKDFQITSTSAKV